jgi:16S rRNA G527 N7-methylase RsmG
VEHDPAHPDYVSRETPPLPDTEWWTQTQLDNVLDCVGVLIDDHQRALLDRFAGWLVSEAQPAGGLGPAEHTRLFDRHIADSIMYAVGLPNATASVVDIGSGVGLPGIPLAILNRDRQVTLVDRSEKRASLARRCVRLLGLSNVVVLNCSVRQVSTRVDAPFGSAVFRASLPVAQATRALAQVVSDDGVGLVGVSRQVARPDIPDSIAGVDYALASYGAEILDSPFWLLRMQRTPL